MTWVNVISDGRGSVAGMTLISASRLAKGALEAGEPAHHGLALHRERDADVPRHAEARARHREHTLLGQQADEGHVVLDGRTREDVERPLRLHRLRAEENRPLVH